MSSPLDTLATLASGRVPEHFIRVPRLADDDHITRMCQDLADAASDAASAAMLGNWAREYLRSESRTKRAIFATAILVDDEGIRKCASDAEWRAPEAMGDIASRFGQCAVGLPDGSRDAALEVVGAEYPEWAEQLRGVETSAAHFRCRLRELAEAVTARGADNWSMSSGSRRFLEAIVERHGFAKVADGLPAIDGALNPVLALRERLEGHFGPHAPFDVVRPEAVMLRGGGWHLTWVRWAGAGEQIEACRARCDGSRERLWLGADARGRWGGAYTLQSADGRCAERFEVWKAPSSGEAFASLNRRRMELVGEPPG